MALRVSIGQYYSVDSPVHRLDPRVKLVTTLVYMASCLAVTGPAPLALAAAAVLAATATARVPLGRLLGRARPLAVFLALTALINLLSIRTGSVVWVCGPLAIHTGGVETALLYTVRFALLLLAGSLLLFTTTPVALADALGSLLAPLARRGVPVDRALTVLSVALRFVPTLAREADNLVSAQTARGAALETAGPAAYLRACIPLAAPLFASALRHADNLGRAMDARCYTGEGPCTRYRVLALDARRDGPAIAAVALYLVALAAMVALA